VRLGLALDAPPPGWHIRGDIKPLAAHLLAGGAIDLRVQAGDAGWLRHLPTGDGPMLPVTDCTVDGVALHPPTLAIGVGAERGVAIEELRDLVDATLADAGLAPQSVAALGTLDVKADEAAVLALPWPLRLFDAASLEAQTPRLANPSETVFAAVGCHGVAEAAALALAGPEAELLVPKRKSARATCAIARAPRGLPQPLAGRPRGHLAIVGIGPGRADWRTPAATAALRDAELAIGYAGYLEQIGDLIGDRAAFGLGEERQRAIAALDAAGAGQRVCLVCSGDAGIYAMAALVYELLDTAPKPAWRTAAIEVIPGVSAAQAAAARAGAPLGHDFCCISLSDLLTPWTAIEKRLRAAADADFVIALYNPASQRRRQPLTDALAILRAARAPETPVVVARDVGRPDETIVVTTLAALDADTVDMLTLLIVGASTTRALAPGWVYTPRGYRA
jgi:cobalt-precorrin 5A hydrolase/precorrin-3B C17-methyltransferase